MDNVSQQFYKLNADPFRLSPDLRFSFSHRSYKKGFADLKLGLDAEGGFIVITGRPGTGKTMLINETVDQLDTNKTVVATLVTTQYEAHDLLSMIASSFSLKCYSKSKSIILLELEKFLWMEHSRGKRALLIVDEAQGLGADAFEQLQALSDLQDKGKPLLQIILVGQEELRDIINSPKLENLRKRVISSIRLEPLSESETIDYITHRLRRAGWTGDPEITKGADCLAYHFSEGIPRIINRVFNRFLLHGYFMEKHELNADDMKSVLEELSEEQLLADKYVVPSDIEEKSNILENEYIQPLNRIKKTSGPAEYPGGFNNPESTIQTDENTDSVSADNNSYGDTRDSNDESRVHTGATVSDSPTIRSPDVRKRLRWPGNYIWLSVSIAIAVAAGLKIYSGFSRDNIIIQSQADIDLRSPAHQAQPGGRIQVDIVPAPETGNKAGKTSTVKAVKPAESEQTNIHETASDTTPASASLTMDALLATQWVTDTGRQAPHLPSFITNCSARPGSTECWSLEHLTEYNGKFARVKTKSYIRDFTESGFTIRYKHMLPGGANDKRRREDQVHQLDCMVIDRDKIECKEDGDNGAVIFTRNTSDQLSSHFNHTLLTSAKWMKDNQPATFLPSYITSCQSENGHLSCWSKSRKHKSSRNMETIKTKALLGQIIDGDFTVTYQNLVMSSLGTSVWENNKHEARCSIQDFNNIVCEEDNTLMTYTKDIQKF